MQGLHGLKDCTIVCKNLLQTQIRKIFEKKYVKLVLSQNVEGIFNSKVSDFRVTKSLEFLGPSPPGPTRALPGTNKRAPQPPLPPKKNPAEIGLPKKSLDTSLFALSSKLNLPSFLGQFVKETCNK